MLHEYNEYMNTVYDIYTVYCINTHTHTLPGYCKPLSGPEFTNQYFIYYVRKLPVWVNTK